MLCQCLSKVLSQGHAEDGGSNPAQYVVNLSLMRPSYTSSLCPIRDFFHGSFGHINKIRTYEV
jgi:hypothetical protein